MGKATIITAHGEGLYTIKPVPANARAKAETEKLTARIAEIDDLLPSLEASVNDALAALQLAEDKFSAAVSAYRSNPEPEYKTVLESAQTGVREAQTQLIDARRTKSQAMMQKTSAQKGIDFLAAEVQEPEETDAWCADFSETLSGEVGTIEIGRKPGDPPIIRPAGTDGTEAAHVPATDGQVQPIVSGTPWSVFWNAAMRPGMDKWKPRYRIGQITAINGDSCNVDLEPATAGSQKLNINQTDTLEAVSIVYMNCNGAVFEIGDRVVIEFQNQDWKQPRVIGFEDNPRRCGVQGFFSRNGDARQWLKYEDSAWTAREVQNLKYGNIDWRGHNGDVLSWKGVPSRYFDEEMTVAAWRVYSIVPGLVFKDSDGEHGIITKVFQQLPAGTTLQGVIDAGTVGQYIESESYFYDGQVYFRGYVAVSSNVSVILGAAIHRAETGDKIIYVEATGTSGTGSPLQRNISEETFWIADFQNGKAKNARQVHVKNWPYQSLFYANYTSWFFNASATEATAVRNVGTYEGDGIITAKYYRYRLAVDWNAETLAFTELGETGVLTKTTDATFSGFGATSETGTESIRGSCVWEFADYDGDTEIVGRIGFSEESDKSSHATYDEPDGAMTSTSGNFSNTQSVEIIAGGVTVYSGTIGSSSGSWSSSSSGTGGSSTRDWNTHSSKNLHLTMLDLRTRAFEIHTSSRDTASAQYTTEYTRDPDTGETSSSSSFTGGATSFHYSAKLSGPGFLDTPSGTSPETDNVTEEQMLNIGDPPSEYTGGEPSKYFTETQYQSRPGGVTVENSFPMIGRYAFYPGDDQRSFVAVPAAYTAMEISEGITWAHDGGDYFRHLTGGEPLTLTEQSTPGQFNPIGAG